MDKQKDFCTTKCRSLFYFQAAARACARGRFSFSVKWLCAPRGPERSSIKADCSPSLSALASLFYVVFFATFIAYLFIPIALKRIRPTTISMYNYAQPLVAATLAILMSQDTLTWDKPIAALLVFTGVYLVTQSKSRADLENEGNFTTKNKE